MRVPVHLLGVRPPDLHSNEDGEKLKAMGKWRKKVLETLLTKVSDDTKERMYIPFNGAVDIDVTWHSTNTCNSLYPDVDNILVDDRRRPSAQIRYGQVFPTS